MTSIILTSPMCGWAVPLSEVPDPVFADRMLGDGIAIDPTGTSLHAPCDGVVIGLHAGRHAVTIRSDEGAEILMHIGIDTVALAGRGFVPRVTEGQRVERGMLLVDFDLAALLPEVRAMVTPILVTNTDAFTIVRRDADQEVGIGQTLMILERRAADPAEVERIDGDEHRLTIRLPLAHGIHARPAARITDCARQYRAEAMIWKGERSASARSAVALLTLGAAFDDEIEIVTRGTDAAQAAAALRALISGGMGENATSSAAPAIAVIAAAVPPMVAAADGTLVGVTAAPGLAVGHVRWLTVRDRNVPFNGCGPAIERDRLDAAIRTIAGRLAEGGAPARAHAIQAAHLALVSDPELRAAAERSIEAGRSAEHGWREALRTQAALLRDLADPRFAERADDLLDIERQVLAALAGETAAALPDFPRDTILLADDLLPSQVMALDTGVITGLATVRGGPTSHVAILAAGMGLPAVVALGEALLSVGEGCAVILDAGTGHLHTAPTDAEIAGTRDRIAQSAAKRALAQDRAALEARTADGTRIEAFANLGSIDDARLAVQNGAEGCGLLRTEFLFLDRPDAPTEAEQLADYQQIADALDGRPLIIRLLDIGGDKPAPYLPIAPEENPALGLRGIRVGLAYPDLLRAQVRAILRVSPHGRCRIMVPMIASLAELRAVRVVLDEVRADLGVAPVELGVMIETPAAAVTADLIAAEADFLSIGSNDLTQYALAMDRGNAAVASGIDGLHPAVLRLIRQTCDGATANGRWTGVCGGLASDPLAVPILIGLGVTELSATPALVPEIKAIIRSVTTQQCRALAQDVLHLATVGEIRQRARAFQEAL